MAGDTYAGEGPTEEPPAEIVERDASLSPIRTLDRDRTFRLRDGAIALIASAAVYVAIIAPFAYGLLPEPLLYRTHWGVALAEAFAAGIVIAFAWRRGIRIRELFLDRSPWYVEAFWGVAAALVIWIGFQFAKWLGPQPVDPALIDLAQADLGTRGEFLILGALFAPLGEELLFRGAIQSSLYARAGAFVACLIQAILFGAIHQRGLEIVLWTGVIGLALGALALWRASLLAPMVAHGTLNGIYGVWLIVAFHLSQHVPAANMDEAQTPPAWVHEPMTFGISLESSAEEQYWKANETYGVEGWMLPKDEVRALLLVRKRFPEDEEFGAWSSLDVAEIYRVELRDPRRAIVSAHQVLRETENREIEAGALTTLACARIDLDQPEEAAKVVDLLERKYADLETTAGDAAYLRSWIDAATARE